jgi:NTE family protein
LKIPFGAVAANLLDGKAYAITTGNVGRALQASSAIPALRRPVQWQGKLFVDGGVINNMPVEQCRAMGADIVIAVDVDERLDETSPAAFHHIGSVPDRCINMHLAKLDEPQLKQADLTIHPNVDGIELLSRKMKDIAKAEQAGEEAALAALPAIKKVIDNKLCDSKDEEEL